MLQLVCQSISPNMNLLALDYGLRHLGLAIAGDSLLAEPLPGFINKSEEHTIKILLHLLDHHHIDKLIIGLPSGKLKPTIEDFANQFQQLTSVPIEFWPESHTTKQAVSQSRQAGKSSVKIKAKEHSLAAAVILQDYLDSNQP